MNKEELITDELDEQQKLITDKRLNQWWSAIHKEEKIKIFKRFRAEAIELVTNYHKTIDKVQL